MKTILTLTLLVASTCFGNPIEGTWLNTLSRTGDEFVEFKEDGTYAGNPLGYNTRTNIGKYEMLSDGSGLIIRSDDRAYIVDIRENKSNRLVLVFGSTAIILKRVEADAIRKQVDELLEQSRKAPYINNLKRIVSAGKQYMLEERTESVGYDKLTDDLLPNFKPVDQESYQGIIIHSKGGKISVKNASGEVFEYAY